MSHDQSNKQIVVRFTADDKSYKVFRQEGWNVRTRVTQEIYEDDLEKVIAEMRAAAEGLEDVTVERTGWYDDRHDQGYGEIYVVGFRNATADEASRLATVERETEEKAAAERERAAARSRELDEAALRRAQAAFPEMFKRVR